MTIDCWAAGVYWVIALIASGLYGWHGVSIFKPHIAAQPQQPAKAWWWHQRWFYFLGGLAGWLAFWLLMRKFGGCVFGACAPDIKALDIVGALVAFVGVTGYLPISIVSLVSGIGGLVEALSAWIERR